ncbi:MAG: MFS transporter [Alphaproteobacteria bacterium]|nr:MFS transporter [Alphaproteobacteria bacterium]
MQRDRKAVLVLSVCQLLFGTSRSLLIATAPLIAYTIAEHKELATLPHAMVIVGTALLTLPASLAMHRLGRRDGFLIGTLLGAIGGAVCIWAILEASFWLFTLGTLLYGSFAGFAQHYRFAAADAAADAFKPKAISLVLASGVVAAFAGPETAKLGKDLLSGTPFVGSYACMIVLMLASAVTLMFLDIPKPSRKELEGPRRPMAEIMRQPVFIAAALAATLGQAVMNFLMTAAPIAMTQASHQFADTALVIEWHVFGMFAPGFFTGSLIRRFGEIRVIAAGLFLELVCIGVALSGTAVFEFWLSMLLLGVGWNFVFTGGTSLMTSAYRNVAERGKTQGAMNFIIYGFVACVSLSSGAFVHYLGWQWVNILALPLLAIAVAATLWYATVARGLQPASGE